MLWIQKPRMCSILLHPDWIHNIWALSAHMRTPHPLTLFHLTPGPACPGWWQRRGLMWDPSLPAKLQQVWDTAQPGHSTAAAFPHPPPPQEPKCQSQSPAWHSGLHRRHSKKHRQWMLQVTPARAVGASQTGLVLKEWRVCLPLLGRCRSPNQARGQSYPQTPLAARAGCINKGLTRVWDLQSHSLQPWKSCAANSHSEVSLCVCQQRDNMYA